MSDILPKVKIFITLSFFQLVINIGVFLSRCVMINSLNINEALGLIGTSFVPLTSFIPLVLTGFDPIAILILGIFTGLITGLQIYFLIEIIYAHIPLVDT